MLAALWDLDGTLVDTSEEHYLAWRDTCRAHGRDLTRAEFAATFGRRNEETIPLLFGALVAGDVAEAIAHEKEVRYRAVAAAAAALLPGVADLLEDLVASGFRQAIGSSAPPENVALLVAATRTERFFETIVTGADVKRGKPDPEVFLTAAARLGVPAQRCVVLEDAPAGIQAARAAGMRAVGILYRSHHDEAALRNAGADLVVNDLTGVSAVTLARLVREGAPA